MLAATASLVSLGVHRIVTLRNRPEGALGGLLMAICVILAWKVYKAWIERTPDRELAAPGAWRELGSGLVFGTALFSMVTAIVWLVGGIDFLGLRGGIGALWSMLAVAFVSGSFEELLFRGVLLRQLERLFGTVAALVLSSAFFGAAHLMNPGATLFAAFAIAVEAGLMLGAAYLLTRRLWLAMGIHAAWNFAQGWIFSIPISGGKPPRGLLLTRVHGPGWLTGGAFGLEASVVALIVCATAGAWLLTLAVRRGALRPRERSHKTIRVDVDRDADAGREIQSA